MTTISLIFRGLGQMAMCDIVPGQIMFGRPIDGPGAEVAERVLERLVNDRAFRDIADPTEEGNVSDDHALTPQRLLFTPHEDPPYMVQRMVVARGREREAADVVQGVAFEESVRHAAGDARAAEQLARRAQRVIGQPIHYVHPLDDAATAEPFRLSDTHWRHIQALDLKTNGDGRLAEPTVAVLDGGFDWSQVEGLQTPIGTVESPVELVAPAVVPTAAVTHGTLVSLMVLSTYQAARVLPIRVFGEPGTADGLAATEWSLMHGLRVALEAGADVINISMGLRSGRP